jgi:hypothetical protein
MGRKVMDEQLFDEFPKEFTETFLAGCDTPSPTAAFIAGLERRLLEQQNALSKPDQQPAFSSTSLKIYMVIGRILGRGGPVCPPRAGRSSGPGGHAGPPLRQGYHFVWPTKMGLALPAWSARHRWQSVVLVLLVVLAATLLVIGPGRVVAQIQTWLGYLPGAGFVNPEQTRILAAPFEAKEGNSTLVVQQVIAYPDKTIVVVKLTSTAEEINTHMQWDGLVTLIRPDGQRLGILQSSENISDRGELSAEIEYPSLQAGDDRVTLEMPKLPIATNGTQEFWTVSLPLQAVRAVAPYTPKNGQASNQGVTVRVLQVGQSAQDTGVLVEIDWKDPTWDYVGSGAELRDNLGKVYQRMEPYPGSNNDTYGVPQGKTTTQEMLRFPALDANARQVTLSLNSITFEIHPQAQFAFDPGSHPSLDQTWSFAGDPSKRLEIAGFQVQVLQADLAYAPASDQVTVVNPPSATALPQPTPLPAYACRLEFVLQVTPQAHAQLFPGAPKLVGGDQGLSGASSVGDFTRVTIYMDLPELPTTPMTVQLNGANLMLEGGWKIGWDLPRVGP